MESSERNWSPTRTAGSAGRFGRDPGAPRVRTNLHSLAQSALCKGVRI